MKKKGVIILLISITLIFSSTLIISSISENFQGKNHSMKGAWTYEGETSKVGGYAESVVGDGNYVYILREYSSSYSPYFWKFDPSDGSITDLNISFPKGTFQNGAAMAYDYSGNFYVLTGGSYDSGADRVAFYRYNISRDEWTRLADTPHVQGAGDAIVYSEYDGMIYAFVGRAHYNGDYKADNYSVFLRYDPKADTWSYLQFPDWPGTDDGASLAWTGGRYIYALEGEFYENSPLRNFARYDIEADEWENMSEIPTKDGVGDGGSLLWIGHYDSSFSNVIYAFDGNGCNETPGYNFTVYYINNDTWAKLEDIPAPVGDYVGNRLAYAQGKIYYWQGTPSTWEGGGKGIYSYTPAAQVPEFTPSVLAFSASLIAIALAALRRE